MGPAARSSGSGSGLGSSPLLGQHRRHFRVQQLTRSLARGLPGAALALLLCLLFGLSGATAQALEDPTRWTLADQGGDRWGLVLLQQADPAYSPGWRLRLNALGGQPALDHQRSLRLKDGQGGAW